MINVFNNKNLIKFDFLIIFILFLTTILIISISSKEQENQACGDGTQYETCSVTKPYFCDRETKILTEKASVCGCNNLSWQAGDLCVSKYESYPKNINLEYTIDEKENKMVFTAYGEMADYFSKIQRDIEYINGEIPSRTDFKLKVINNKEQRELLMPLVTEIQNLNNDKTIQAKIAISLVQKIPYETTGKNILLPSGEIDYAQYPYEVLYYNQGICGEKSALLAFLLKELGYGVSIFYFPEENHEAVGIKCPMKNSFRNSGYCFIETAGPSIISDFSMEYTGGLRLKSEPEILVISDGISLPEKMPEYKDAKDISDIRNRNIWSLFKFWKADDIKEKYGLIGEYNLL